MTLKEPVCITSRLLPGLKVGDSEISIEFGDMTREGRVRYRYYIDGPDLEYNSDDLKSGVGGGSLQQGLASLLSFLSAAAEAVRYSEWAGRESDNRDMFPEPVMRWAAQHASELELLDLELEENPDAITA